MHLRKNIAALPHSQSRWVPPRSSGACSFRDFFGSKLQEIDHLVNCGYTGPREKCNASIAFIQPGQKQSASRKR
jgi:hypothetical protein